MASATKADHQVSVYANGAFSVTHPDGESINTCTVTQQLLINGSVPEDVERPAEGNAFTYDVTVGDENVLTFTLVRKHLDKQGHGKVPKSAEKPAI